MNAEQKQDWYFTFGAGQVQDGYYVIVHGTFAEARMKMFNKYGPRWSGQYNKTDFLNESSLHDLELLERL